MPNSPDLRFDGVFIVDDHDADVPPGQPLPKRTLISDTALAIAKAGGDNPLNQPFGYETLRRSDEWIEARDEFKAKWDDLVAEGMELGILIVADTVVYPQLESDEYEQLVPNPDFDADAPNPFAA